MAIAKIFKSNYYSKLINHTYQQQEEHQKYEDHLRYKFMYRRILTNCVYLTYSYLPKETYNLDPEEKQPNSTSTTNTSQQVESDMEHIIDNMVMTFFLEFPEFREIVFRSSVFSSKTIRNLQRPIDILPVIERKITKCIEKAKKLSGHRGGAEPNPFEVLVPNLSPLPSPSRQSREQKQFLETENEIESEICFTSPFHTALLHCFLMTGSLTALAIKTFRWNKDNEMYRETFDNAWQLLVRIFERENVTEWLRQACMGSSSSNPFGRKGRLVMHDYLKEIVVIIWK